MFDDAWKVTCCGVIASWQLRGAANGLVHLSTWTIDDPNNGLATMQGSTTQTGEGHDDVSFSGTDVQHCSRLLYQ